MGFTFDHSSLIRAASTMSCTCGKLTSDKPMDFARDPRPLALQRPPRLHQRHTGVVNHLAMVVPRILLVAGWKLKGYG